MIYTSYFAVANKLPRHIERISIELVTPDWYTGLTYKELAPSYDLLKLAKSGLYDEYIKRYKAMLDKLDGDEVVENIELLVGSDNICLLCYERSKKFCHRHLVSEWLRSYGYESEEYKFLGDSI